MKLLDNLHQYTPNLIKEIKEEVRPFAEGFGAINVLFGSIYAFEGALLSDPNITLSGMHFALTGIGVIGLSEKYLNSR